jgi:WD40 repeat protein
MSLWKLNLHANPVATLIRRTAAHVGVFDILAVSPDSRLLVSAGVDADGSNAIKFWTLPDLRLSGKAIHYVGVIGATVFGDEGRILAAASGNGDQLTLVDVGTRASVRKGAESPVEAIWFGSPGRLAAVGKDRIIFWQWDRKNVDSFHKTGEDYEYHRTAPPFAPPLSATGGALLAGVGNDGTIDLVDLHSGEKLATFSSRVGPAPLAFDPDARTLATVDHQGTPALWDIDVNRALGRIEAPPNSTRNQPSPFGCR